MGSRVTIRDVAFRAEVSTSTVSRVINNEAAVSDGTRERVQAVIDQLGFCPNSAAGRLAGIRIQRLKRNENASRTSDVVSEAAKSLYFEGAWSSKDRGIVVAAIRQRRFIDVPWLYIKTLLDDDHLFVAIQLRASGSAVIARTPGELANRMRQISGLSEEADRHGRGPHLTSGVKSLFVRRCVPGATKRSDYASKNYP